MLHQIMAVFARRVEGKKISLIRQIALFTFRPKQTRKGHSGDTSSSCCDDCSDRLTDTQDQKLRHAIFIYYCTDPRKG